MCRREAEVVDRRDEWIRVAGLVFGAALWCGCGSGPSGPAGPEDILSERGVSEHFLYRWSPQDAQPDTSYQERHFRWVSGGLGITPAAPLEYFKYRDAAHLERMTGHDRGTGFADGTRRFHSIFPTDNHEYVHALVMSEVGSSPPLFNEGIAVAHHGASIAGDFGGDPLWNGTSARSLVRAMRTRGEVPPLDDLLEENDFWSYETNLSYPVAGMFVRYLLDEAGPEPLLSFIERCPAGAGAVTVRARFLEAYGQTIDVWWERWSDAL